MARNFDFRLKMIRSRIIVGLAVAVVILGPLFMLAQLSYDYRYSGLPQIFERSGSQFPWLAEAFVPFGPIDWWSYITPVALGVAAGAALPVRHSLAASIVIVLGALSQFLALWAAFLPYSKLLQLAGAPILTPYPPVPLIANVSTVGVSIGLAFWSVARLRASLRDGKESIGSKKGDS